MMEREVSTVRRQIGELKARWLKEYGAAWRRFTAEWSADGSADRIWLTYSANYLLRTGGVRWAIDPFTLRARLPEAESLHLAEDLRPLAFVVLTHRHADHLDMSLVHALRDLPMWWIIPEFMYEAVAEQAGIPRARVIIPKMLEPIQIDGVTITAFPGLHWEYPPGVPPQPRRGVPALGYLAEFQNIRCLFPGDTRSYDAGQLPSFGAVDIAFAHLWLGRHAALFKQPPLLDAFCRFCLALEPRRLVITHLNELGREPEDYWHLGHFDLVQQKLGELAPALPVSACLMGQGEWLSDAGGSP